MINRVILLVIDSLGIGELPDAHIYGDGGSNTLGNLHKKTGLDIPNLIDLGLGNIPGVNISKNPTQPMGCFGKSREASPGKDTTTGHWELAGIVLDQPFPTYPEGFPEEVIQPFIDAIGRGILGNIAASGTEIIEKLGSEHIKTEYPIVYTSADSVFQIAAHEEVIPVDRLYDMCMVARKILRGKHGVGRVIARPFIGQPGNFVRTQGRRDFSLEPPGITILDRVKEQGMDVIAVGKIEDIFAGKGITKAVHTQNNQEGIQQTISRITDSSRGLIFTNLVDFDMKYGHRNDPYGYAQALEYFDARLPEIMSSMDDADVLIITADHGCDPTTESTDHSREYIPIIIYGRSLKTGVYIGERSTFADVGATIADMLNVQPLEKGESFYDKIKK
jgi:phosphopentomutase